MIGIEHRGNIDLLRTNYNISILLQLVAWDATVEAKLPKRTITLILEAGRAMRHGHSEFGKVSSLLKW